MTQTLVHGFPPFFHAAILIVTGRLQHGFPSTWFLLHR